WFEWTEEIDDWISTVTAIGHQVREENTDGGYGTTEEEVRAYVFLEALGRHAHRYERAFPMERRVSALYYGCSMTYARAVERLSAAWLRDAPGDIHGALRAIRIAREMGFLVE